MGSTPLFDAIGRLIETLGKRVAKAAHLEEDQIICIITDGAENASTDFSAAEIKALIDARTEAGFTFIFLGANQDSFTTGEEIGMQRGNTRNFTASGDGASRVFEEVSGTVAEQRIRSRDERRIRKDDLLADRFSETETLGAEPSTGQGGKKSRPQANRQRDKNHFRPRPGESLEDLSRRIREATNESRKTE